MTFVTTQPEMLAAAAGQLTGIGTELNAQNAAAMAPTTGVIPAAADEVSALTAAQFAVSRRGVPGGQRPRGRGPRTVRQHLGRQCRFLRGHRSRQRKLGHLKGVPR